MPGGMRKVERAAERLLGISATESRLRNRYLLRTMSSSKRETLREYARLVGHALLVTLDLLRALLESTLLKDGKVVLALACFASRQLGKLYLIQYSVFQVSADYDDIACEASLPLALAAVRAAPMLADPFTRPRGYLEMGRDDIGYALGDDIGYAVGRQGTPVPPPRSSSTLSGSMPVGGTSVVGSMGSGKSVYSSQSLSDIHPSVGMAKLSPLGALRGSSLRPVQRELAPGENTGEDRDIFKRLLRAAKIPAIACPEALSIEPYSWRALGRAKPWPSGKPRISYRLAVRVPGLESEGGKPRPWMRPWRRAPIGIEARRAHEEATGENETEEPVPEAPDTEREWPATPRRASAELVAAAIVDPGREVSRGPEKAPTGVVEEVWGIPGRWFYEALLPRLIEAFLSPAYAKLYSHQIVEQRPVWRAEHRGAIGGRGQSGERPASPWRRYAEEAASRVAGEEDEGYATGVGYMDVRDTDLGSARYIAASMHGADLRDALLEHSVFERSVLCEADLRRSKASRSSFPRSDMRGSILDEAEVPGASFEGANLSGASLDKINGREAAVDFSHAAMLDASLAEADIPEARMYGVSGAGAVLYRAKLNLAQLGESSWQYANAREVGLGRSDLGGADLTGIDLREGNLENASLSGTRLRWANLDGACLRGVRDRGGAGREPFHGTARARLEEPKAGKPQSDPRGSAGAAAGGGAGLPPAESNRAWLHGGVDLRWASLRRCDMRSCQLMSVLAEGADLEGVDIERGRLQGQMRGISLRRASAAYLAAPFSDMEDADLRDTDLLQADLRRTYLRGAKLAGASLVEADLGGADLRGAEGFAEADVRGASLVRAFLTDEQRVLAHMMGARLDGEEAL